MWKVFVYMDGEDGVFNPFNKNVIEIFSDADYDKAKDLVEELDSQGMNADIESV